MPPATGPPNDVFLGRRDSEPHGGGRSDLAGRPQCDGAGCQHRGERERADGCPRHEASPPGWHRCEDGCARVIRDTTEQFVNPQARLADVTQARFGILLQAAHQQAPESRRRRRRQWRHSGSLSSTAASVVETSSPCERPGGRPASRTARQPNAQMSARLSTGLPLRLLRRHVGRGAEDHAAHRHRRRGDRRRIRQVRRVAAAAAGSRLQRLREPEVQHLHRAVGADLDVRGLQVAVDDALLVRGLERLGDLPARSAAPRRAGSARARSAPTDRRPRPVPSPARRTPPRLLRDRRSAAMFGMVQRRQRLALRARTAPAAPGRWRRRRQDLDRDVAVEPRVARAIDLAHPAGAEWRRISYGPSRVPGVRAMAISGSRPSS